MKLVPLIALVAFLQTSGFLFEVDLWPGEGRPIFEAASRSLELHELPLGSSKASRTVTVALKQRLSFDDTRYRTIESGRITVLAAASITGRTLGFVSRLSREDYYKGMYSQARRDVQPGLNVDYLQYRAEGTCFVRVSGAVIDADPCPINDKAMFRLETEPKTEWWIHVVLPDNSAGWLLVTDSKVKLVDREF
jgi:hypothetical protein